MCYMCKKYTVIPGALMRQQILNLWPKLCMLPCLFRLFWPLYELFINKERKRKKIVPSRVVIFTATKKEIF